MIKLSYAQEYITDATKTDYTKTTVELVCHADELEIGVTASILMERIFDNIPISPGVAYYLDDNLVWVKEKIVIEEVKKFMYEFIDKHSNLYPWMEQLKDLI